jgi:sigma-B regulation protein RsbU (phosphoserine phosphatase)
MAITHAIAHTRPGPAAPPAAVLRYVNEKLAARYTANGGTFVTAFYAVYDPVARTLTHACAGHNPPRLRRRDGSVTSLDCRPGLPLGIDPGEDYEDCTERLAPGNALLLYTDGITEARGPGGDMFGTDRLDAVLAAPGVETDAIVPGVLERLRAFTNGAPAKDDQTLLSLAVV